MKLWGYDGSTGSFRMYYEDVWRDEITIAGAAKYLSEQLKQSLIDDFETAYFVYAEKGTGYFGCLRLILPLLTFLGTLFKGHDRSRNVVEFIQKYMGKVNVAYRQMGDVLYAVYRHGLAHTNMPKIITVDGQDVGWVITLGNELHLTISPIGLKKYNIWISPFQLYKDLLKAIDLYIDDLKTSDDVLLFSNFKDGYVEMAKYHDQNDIQMNCDVGFDFIRGEILKLQESKR